MNTRSRADGIIGKDRSLDVLNVDGRGSGVSSHTADMNSKRI